MNHLQRLLTEHAILRTSAERPLRDQHGRTVPWMFYSWGLSLRAEGIQVLGQALWDAVQPFAARHVAAYGLTALPLVTACVAAAGGACEGLAVRKDPKGYGTLRRVEGSGPSGQPVLLLDDSLSSGTAALTAIELLEAEGYPVEGVICLVEFPGRGGRCRLESLNYKVVSLFDVDRSLGMAPPPARPMALSLMPEQFGETLAEGMDPATLARAAMVSYLATGLTPQPPKALDRDYDGRGGVFVSLRDIETDARPSRDGFWHFPGDVADPPRDVVLAAVKTLVTASSPLTLENLSHLKMAVTFFGPLEPIAPARLEFATHGIVVRSRVWNAKMGGALPNTQVFTHELEQYRQARFANAQLDEHEPHELFRHTVSKCVEAGVEWPSYGVAREDAWTRDSTLGEALVGRARDLLAGLTPTEALPVVPEAIYTVAVSLYREGCATVGMAWEGALDECLARAVAQLPHEAGRLAVWVLHTTERLGPATTQLPGVKVRLGLDSLAVFRDDKHAILLPPAATHANRGKAEFVGHALELAGIAEPGAVANWSTFQTAGWVETGSGVRPLEYGFVERRSEPYPVACQQSDVPMLAAYLAEHLDSPLYLPCQDTDEARESGWVTLYAAGVLLDAANRMQAADWRARALRSIDAWAVRTGLEPLARCCLIGALARLGRVPDVHADWLHSLVRADGRITLEVDARNAVLDHDGLPGFVLRALAYLDEIPPLERTLRWYQRRFKAGRPWLLVATQLPAWSALAPRVPEASDFIGDLADWLLDWQHTSSGAFLAELQPMGPSCQTAWLGSSMAAACRLMQQQRHGVRADRYRQSWQAALRFVNRLVVRDDDTFCMPAPPRAVGGVRRSLNRSDMPLEAAAHFLNALLV